MWFKNIQVFKCSSPLSLDTEQLQEQLNEQRFQPCKSIETYRLGWVFPAAKSGQLLHVSNKKILLCLRRQEKVIPAAVVNEILKERVEELELKDHRKVGRKEKMNIKEDILTEMTPRAFAKSSYTWGYIDLANQWVVVDAASSKKAEEFLDLLRRTIGSLPVIPLNTEVTPATLMTHWLNDISSRPAGLALNGQCVLRSDLDEGSVVRVKQKELDSEDVQAHLQSGKQVTAMAVDWQERVQCTLNEDLSIKRLRFGDDLLTEAQDSYADEDPMTRLDADFTLMTLELQRFLHELIGWLGGIHNSAKAGEKANQKDAEEA